MPPRSNIDRRKDYLNLFDKLGDQTGQDIEYNEDVALCLDQLSQKLENISHRLIDAKADSQAKLDKISRQAFDAKAESQSKFDKVSHHVIDIQAELQTLVDLVNRRNRVEFGARNEARSQITSLILSDLCLDSTQSNHSPDPPFIRSSNPADSTHDPSQNIPSPISINSAAQDADQQDHAHHQNHDANRPSSRPRAEQTPLGFSKIIVVASVDSTIDHVRDQTTEADASTIQTPQSDASTLGILQEDALTLDLPQSDTVPVDSPRPQVSTFEDLAAEALAVVHAAESPALLRSSPTSQINSWTSVQSHRNPRNPAPYKQPTLIMTPQDGTGPIQQTPPSLPQSSPPPPVTRPEDGPPQEKAQITTLSAIDEAEIILVRDIFHELGPDASRKELWARVSDNLTALGFIRQPGSCAMTWSASLRDQCEARGHDWARHVMRKQPYKYPRKRKQDLVIKPRSSDHNPSAGRSGHKRRKQKDASQDSTAFLEEAQDFHFDQLMFQKALSWKGASWDVNELAWSPSGTHFIAGAVVNDVFNNPNNLVSGSALDGVLAQLPGHQLRRDLGSPGVPTYCSVTAIRYLGDGRHAYTSGFDNTVRVWDTQHSTPRYQGMIEYTEKVLVMDVSSAHNLLATGVTHGPQSLQIHNLGGRGLPASTPLYPLKKQTTFAYTPTCLQFGKSQANHHWLVAGFGATTPFESLSDTGRLALWKISESIITDVALASANTEVFSVAWFSKRPGFVSASMSTPEQTDAPKHKTRLHVYDLKQPRPVAQFYSEAADVNDVTICETDENLISASFTDGTIRIWDLRQPSTILLSFSHGDPVAGCFQNAQEREMNDVGIRMTDWGDDAGRLFTGGSDGVIRCWNPKLSVQDAESTTVFECDSEIMSGVFSPDRESLLIGDGDKGLHLLTKTAENIAPSDAYGNFHYRKFRPAVNPGRLSDNVTAQR